jgi:hypothetical protein
MSLVVEPSHAPPRLILLGVVEVGVSCGDVDSFQDDPQYKVMKYLVFGTILSSLLSELQIIIPKIDRNGVCIGMVNPML